MALYRLRVGRPRALVAPAALALLLSACGSSSPTVSSHGSSTTARPGPSTTVTAGVIIASATVGSYGQVLTDSHGRTLYSLSSEQGGHVTCTTANGCARIWPPVLLPAALKAASAGPGVQAGLLGTAKEAGVVYVTYRGWPLYTFAGDAGPGEAKGEGIASFGGTWSVVSIAGNLVPVSPGASGSTSTTANLTY
jgi:predicted lipoprotein with Yx(FWY)xxD motif